MSIYFQNNILEFQSNNNTKDTLLKVQWSSQNKKNKM
jgi:hypothetical protein